MDLVFSHLDVQYLPLNFSREESRKKLLSLMVNRRKYPLLSRRLDGFESVLQAFCNRH